MNRTMENVLGASHNVYTPRTPRMRERQRFDLSTRPEANEEIDITGLQDLIGQTWNIYAVSVLFGFQRDDVQLKLYSKKLREEIACTLTREDVTYDAKFSILEDIASGSDHENHPAIKIEVLAKINNRDDDKEKSIYSGILLSWRITQIEQSIQNFIRLPLLLCRGTRSCIDAVHTIINHMFDCSVIALPANEDDLSWLIPIIIMPNNKEEKSAVSGEVQMEYIIPQLPVTDTITVKFHISDLRKILTAIVAGRNDDSVINAALDRKHIETFYDVLHTHMLTMGEMQLGLCTLHKINLPGITIMENRMKVTNVEVMNRILLYLNEKAFDTFHTIHINI